MSRPEHQNPPEIYYNDEEATKYTRNTRIIKIQRDLTQRCIEMANIPMLDSGKERPDSESDDMNDSEDEGEYQMDPKMVLDIGCGSGLSGEILSEHGHSWIGCDISKSMLAVAQQEREVEGDLIEHDMGHGLPFRAGTFDAAISVSALQWLCNADKKVNKPAKRLKIFFESLYSVLRHGAKAALQFYPENSDQHEFIWNSAAKAGFTGGTVVDYPNSAKRKKYYLVLFCGQSSQQQSLPDALTETHAVQLEAKFNKKDKMRLCDLRRKGQISNRDWIMAKKNKRRQQGKQTARDSKFSGRKRSSKFWKQFTCGVF